ncbi:MAG TPA: dynamin family protein [Kofleriaceae bacterium]
MSFWSRIERRLQDLAGDLLPDDFRAALDTARAQLEAGNAAEAARTLSALIEERPGHAGAHALLGAAQLELGEIDGAALCFERAAELADDMPEPMLGRGEVKLRLGQAADAVADFRKAQARAGGDRAVLAEAYRGMGIGHRLAGDLDKAIRELRKAVAEAPEDAPALAALGDALIASQDGSRGEARRHLRRADELPDPPILTWLALGRLDMIEGDAGAARQHFTRAAEAARARSGSIVRPPDDVAALADALAGQCDATGALGETDAALVSIEAALAEAPDRPDLHARLGNVLAAAGRPDAALAAYQAALARGAGPAVLASALSAALAAGDLTSAVPLASRMLADDPGDPRALVARGRSLLHAGQHDQAEETLRTALERDSGPLASLALAELELARGADPSRAATWALRALDASPKDEQARSALAAARARELGLDRAARPAAPGDSAALYELAGEVSGLLLSRPDLADLGGEAARAASDFDQPLLVTVMGEFSSGKSTFVNAFIGEDVAPTGVTPTTATINVVKYGRERSGRILYRDGRAESLTWAELFERLPRLDATTAAQVSVVEILLPLEALARVHLVDTPGLNSILPEHEQVARGFISRADAVVWLFAVQQAGKASEREALARLKDEGVRVLGVLNKVDQIDAKEKAALTRHVEKELGGLVEAVVPVSARRAVEKKGEDAAWKKLTAALEERFFSHARDIKWQVLARRLDRGVARACERVAVQTGDARERSERRRRAAEQTRAASARFLEQSVTRERRRLGEAAALLYRSAAREVLDLVVPRRLPFGSHRASRADRDYLVSLLDGGFAALLEQSRRRVDGELRAAGAEAIQLARPDGAAADPALAEVERALSDSIHILDAQVYARTLAYLRGYLEGGTVDNFFRRDLPKLELDEDSVYHALYRDSPDLDATIAVPLAETGVAALDRVAERLAHLAERAQVRAFDLEVGLARALERLRGRLAAGGSR